MTTTLKQQALAIKKAMKDREAKFKATWKSDLENFRTNDKQWKALNDAYSTVIALDLNLKVSNFGAVSKK